MTEQTATTETFDRKKTIRRAVNHLHQYATDEQLQAVARILNLRDDRPAAEELCGHDTVICKGCGKEGSPAQLMAQRKRGPRSPEAAEQSRQAVRIGKDRKRSEMAG